MALTDEQREAIKRGEAVHVTDPQTQLECVLVRADIFDRVRTLLVDDRPLTQEEKLAAIQAAGLRAGWDDPALDVYEQYRKNP
ncbi:MAG: hypothetical protein WD648_14005 [Planctomycetaceae bacterium]